MKPFILAIVLVIAVSTGGRSAVLYSGVPALRAEYPFVYTAYGNSLVTPTQQQYQAQDQFGQYAYGYSEPLSAKQEVHSLDGSTRGTYSYRDPTGKLQTVDYTADAEGFHVAATNLPLAVQPLQSKSDFRTPEASIASAATVAYAPAAAAAISDTVTVAAARTPNLAAHEKTKLRLAQIRTTHPKSFADQSDVRFLELPATVADTADVAAAKSIHLKRVEAEKIRNEVADHASIVVPSLYGYAYPRIYTTGYYY